jgi:hypothetical protein
MRSEVLTSFCASPNHLLIRLEILIIIKTAKDSLTIAFASMVFPVPGGPYNNTPFYGPRSFSCEKGSGFRRGRITSSYKACLIDSNPPIDSNPLLCRGLFKGESASF